MRMWHQLGVQRPLIVAIVGALLDDVLSLSSRDQWPTLLYLPVDEFDLLLDFFEKFLKASLLKDRLGTLQVVFGLLGLRWVADHEQSSNDLESLGDVDGAVSVQRIL